MTPAEHDRVIARAVTMSIVGLGVAVFVYLIRDVLLMLYVSSLLAIGLSPAVRRIERGRLVFGRLRIPRWLAILTLYVAFLLLVAVVIALIVPPLASQVQQLAQNLPGYVDRLQRTLIDRGLIHQQWSWGDLFTNLQVPGFALTSLFGAVQGAIGVLGATITVLLLPFYLLLESAALHAWFLRVVKPERRRRTDRMMRAATVKVGAWLGGQLLLGAVIGASATIGFWLIGVPYFYVLGLVCAVGEMIPVVGPILSAIPAILLGLTVSPQTALLVTGYCWAQQFVENNVLVPRIMERQVGVSPVTIIVALLIGSTLLGIVGRDSGGAHGGHRPDHRPGALRARRPQRRIVPAPRHYTGRTMRPDPLAFLDVELNALREQGLHRSLRILEGRQQATAAIDGRTVVNLSSNNYLGLTTHPRLRERGARRPSASSASGSGSVRTIAGTMAIHMELERRLAVFKQTEAVVVFQSGFAANAGTVVGVPDQGRRRSSPTS